MPSSKSEAVLTALGGRLGLVVAVAVLAASVLPARRALPGSVVEALGAE